MEPLSETQVIQNLRQTEDPSAQYYAAWWLGKMRSQHPDAIPLLLKALGALDATPIDPEQRGVALNAIRALGLLRDMRAEQPLLELLRSNDYTVREEVVRTLGAMGTVGLWRASAPCLPVDWREQELSNPHPPCSTNPVKRCWKPSVTLVIAAAAISL